MKEKIYSIRFNKTIIDGVVRHDGYTVGKDCISYTGTGYISVEKITLVKDKITVYFSDGTKYIIHYNQDVEILKIPVKEDGKDKDEVKPRRVRKSKNTKQSRSR